MTDLTPETRAEWAADAYMGQGRILDLIAALEKAEQERMELRQDRDGMFVQLLGASLERDKAREEAAELRETFDARVESVAGRWKRRAKRAEGLHEAMAVENRRLNGALARVEALVVPQWHTNRGHEYDYLADAYAAGRNDFIDRIRAALADPTDTEGDDHD